MTLLLNYSIPSYISPQDQKSIYLSIYLSIALMPACFIPPKVNEREKRKTLKQQTHVRNVTRGLTIKTHLKAPLSSNKHPKSKGAPFIIAPAVKRQNHRHLKARQRLSSPRRPARGAAGNG